MKCEIIRDLLPSYIDGLTSRESNEAIEEHLTGCVECREMLSEMRKDLNTERTKEETNIQPFLKIKKATAWKVLVAIILTAVVGALGIEYYKMYYYHGKSMSSNEVTVSCVEEKNIKSLYFEPIEEDTVIYIGYAENKPIDGVMPLETISLIKYKKNPVLNSSNENHYSMCFLDEDTVMWLYSYPDEVDFDEGDFIAIQFNDVTKTIKMSDLREGNIEEIK